MNTVYLAGPIAGLGYSDATDWRDAAISDLAASGIKGLSPMRAKEYLKDVTRKLEHPFPLGTPVKLNSAMNTDTPGHGTVIAYGAGQDASYIVKWKDGSGTSAMPHSVVEAVATDIGFSATCEEYGHLSPLSGPRGIMTRDHFDATRCDVLLVNLLGAKKVSIGTVMEIAWAWAKKTPVVVAIEADGSNVHEHCMITEAIGFRCATLDEALHVTKAILL